MAEKLPDSMANRAGYVRRMIRAPDNVHALAGLLHDAGETHHIV